MSYVITQNCCNDAACADVCPVGCIHPSPGEPGYASTEMLYIDPVRCIDCGACAEACPVDAVYSADALPDRMRRYEEINADYYRATPRVSLPLSVAPPRTFERTANSLRVAIVGAGPSGFYAAEQLIEAGAEVSMFDRLSTPFGLVRAGVAPDHTHTKNVTDQFRWTAARREFNTFYNVEVGTHLSHHDLLQYHHAVLYSVGALQDRRLGIVGEDLPGSHAAAEFVAWYNGHPDYADRRFDLSHRRAIIIGNGNVALDIARVLLLPVDELARTDIADHALKALADNNIEEVVVLGRRGSSHAAFTTPELLAFAHLDDIDVFVEDGAAQDAIVPGFSTQLKTKVLAELNAAPRGNAKRLVLRFLASPIEVVGDEQVTGLRVTRNTMIDGRAEPSGESDLLDAGLVLRAVGFRGRAINGVPFNEQVGTIPNDHGRVIGPDGEPVPGVYTAGWIKRGPSGVIGTNKTCAAETVAHLLEDFSNGNLADPLGSADDLTTFVSTRRCEYVDRRTWQRIDEHERTAGRAAGRPAIKLTDTAAISRIAVLPTSADPA
ncbi:4Fe-4S binding protein [Rhodococcus sp. BP22]|uniref:4Fe-4S binding protein n=1 Tax=Rhodococcus sp. BP22 TaxID=2758566 RepID=UPI0016446674|nr:4Fe-4S binding protein [Rhodococcus sp. BP22]